METTVIGFIPPVVGTEKEFNTFRLGWTMAKRLKVGDTVFLLDEKNKLVFGKAEVTQVDSGELAEMCLIHAHKNHTELGHEDRAALGPERLFRLLQKIYGPHIAVPKKKATVIYMRRLE